MKSGTLIKGYIVFTAIVTVLGCSQTATNNRSSLTSVLTSSPAPAFRILKGAPIECPKDSPCYGVHGTVHVSVDIGTDGVPLEVKAISGDPRLLGPVEDAVKKYRFHFTVTPQHDMRVDFNVKS